MNKYLQYRVHIIISIFYEYENNFFYQILHLNNLLILLFLFPINKKEFIISF